MLRLVDALSPRARWSTIPNRLTLDRVSYKLLFLINSYWLSQPTFDTSHQTDSLATDSRLTGVAN